MVTLTHKARQFAVRAKEEREISGETYDFEEATADCAAWVRAGMDNIYFDDGTEKADLNDEAYLRSLLMEASLEAERLIGRTVPDTNMQDPLVAFHIPDGSTASSWELISSCGDRKMQAGWSEDGTRAEFSVETGDIALKLSYEKEPITRFHPEDNPHSTSYQFSLASHDASAEPSIAGRLEHEEFDTCCYIRFSTTINTDSGPFFEIVAEAVSGLHFLIDNLACGIAASHLHCSLSKEHFGVVPDTLVEIPVSDTHDIHLNVSEREILAVARKHRESDSDGGDKASSRDLLAD